MLCSVMRLKKAWKGVRTTFVKFSSHQIPVFHPSQISYMLTNMVVLPPRHKTNHPIFLSKPRILFYWKSSFQVVRWNFSIRNPRAIGLVKPGAMSLVSETCCVLSWSLESLVMGTGIRNTGLRTNCDAADSVNTCTVRNT
jgi:hypothetical protein